MRGIVLTKRGQALADFLKVLAVVTFFVAVFPLILICWGA